MELMRHVKALERGDNCNRGQYVINRLKGLGIKPVIQERRWPSIRNVIVDFETKYEVKRTIISAHYDAIRGSPGANDNASSIAVLLGLCEKLADKYFLYLVDRNKISLPGYAPRIFQNPYLIIFKNEFWKKEPETWVMLYITNKLIDCCADYFILQ